MKQLEEAKDVYLKEYEVNVHPYLSIAQASEIIKGICKISSNDYAERKMCEDMLILFHATDIAKEDLESNTYELLTSSGLIHAVRSKIKNIEVIKEGLDYTESVGRSLSMLAPKILPMLEKVGALNNESNIQK
jgi:hypothetical protein